MDPVTPTETHNAPPLANQSGVARPQTNRSSFSVEGIQQDLTFLDWLTDLGADGSGSSMTIRARRGSGIAQATTEQALELLSSTKAAQVTKSKSTEALTPACNGTACSVDYSDEAKVMNKDLTMVLDMLQDPAWAKQIQLTSQVNGGFQVVFPNLASASSFFGSGGESSYRNIAVSQGLAKMLEAAQKSAKPVRIALDDQSAVILTNSSRSSFSRIFIQRSTDGDAVGQSNAQPAATPHG